MTARWRELCKDQLGGCLLRIACDNNEIDARKCWAGYEFGDTVTDRVRSNPTVPANTVEGSSNGVLF